MFKVKKIFSYSCMVSVMLLVTLLASCNGKSKYSFTTSDEAVSTCKDKLSSLRKIKDADKEKVVEIISDWAALKDSAYNILLNEKSDKINANQAESYFILSDSIREEIARIALENNISMETLVYLKIHTSSDRKSIQNSDLYKSAQAFYESLNNDKTFANVSLTLQNYNELLSSDPFSDENDMLNFIRKEDQCFRSLLMFLNDIKQEDLQTITEKTANYFDKLTQNVAENPESELAERIRLYLMMRFNRRIIQNAIVCKEYIDSNMRLSDIQNSNYRWMIIQPFLSIDNYAMALITPKQEKQLNELAKALPDLLCTLDGFDTNETTAEEKAKISSTLVEYFLRSYLRLSI